MPTSRRTGKKRVPNGRTVKECIPNGPNVGKRIRHAFGLHSTAFVRSEHA